MTSDLDLALDRLVLMQKASYIGSDAVKDYYYTQEATPFWVNKIESFDVQIDSEGLDVIKYFVTMTLALSIITEGWEGEAEGKTRLLIPPTVAFFNQRKMMKLLTSDNPVLNLHPTGIRVTGGNVDYNLQVSGIGVLLFGINFSLELPMMQSAEQAVF